MAITLSQRRNAASEFWVSSFRRSLDNPPEIPWENADKLTEPERKTICASIQEFQLGERSEGRYLKQAAHNYAKRSGELGYSNAIELFIREEQRHAALLGAFMDVVGIPQVRHTWPDLVFRRLRRFGGLEISICVLLTAEVIAKIYYRALLAATASPALRAICRRILQDEARHVQFQAERLAILRRERRRWRVAAAVATQRLLFAGAVAVVWLRHKPVFRLGRYSLWTYWRGCHHEFRECLILMDPAHYVSKEPRPR